MDFCHEYLIICWKLNSRIVIQLSRGQISCSYVACLLSFLRMILYCFIFFLLLNCLTDGLRQAIIVHALYLFIIERKKNHSSL